MGTVVWANEEMNEIMKHAQVRIKAILRSLARMNNALEPKQYYVQRVHHSVCVFRREQERDRRKRKKHCMAVQKRLQESLVLIRVVLCALCSDGYVRIDRIMPVWLCICVQTFPFRGHQWCTVHWRVSIYNLYMNCWSDIQSNARHCDSSHRFVLTGVVE